MMKSWLCAFVFVGFLLPVLAAPPSKNSAPSKNSPLSNVGAIGVGARGSLPDPKRPGTFLWKFTATDFVAQGLDSGARGYLLHVNVTMYDKGVASTRLLAPKAQADGAAKTVIASGRVRALSLTQKGTVLYADRVIWYAATNKVLAIGHVFYKDGKSGMMLESPSMVADTKLRTIRSANPGNGNVLFPKGF